MQGDGMSETISIPVNLWLRGLHLGGERSQAGMGQVNDGQARAGEGERGRGLRKESSMQEPRWLTVELEGREGMRPSPWSGLSAPRRRPASCPCVHVWRREGGSAFQLTAAAERAASPRRKPARMYHARIYF
ncbi:unnamed protein product [Tetraodon nigroviridis]|uniref:(spotted green pufferfish) hypothetical protein n=1 Tax=Tetraodon nigroviridis TaxID=99883 RepID=Q4S580_TETNG|nr:unnamed protein product [Tetraodon nigroviridis]